MNLNFEAPFNTLSFGNVAYNFAKALKKRDDLENVYIWPTSNQLDFSAFKVKEDFSEWFKKGYSGRYNGLKDKTPTLKLWHLNGSEHCVGRGNKYLYTFYECDSPTNEEVILVNSYDEVIFSSKVASDTFNDYSNQTSFSPIGFDEEFHVLPQKHNLGDKVTHWTLFGKLEKRKQTEKIIKYWLQLFANNPDHRLSCFIDNAFVDEKKMAQIRGQINNSASNIQALPFLKNNSLMNSAYNSSDIDLTGLSLAEGHNLPAFNVTALGGWSIVLNHTGHKEWATAENCILIEPDGKEPIYDNVFFKEGQSFNQGNRYSVSELKVKNAMLSAAKKRGVFNAKGAELQKTHTYDKTVDDILKIIKG